MRLTLRTLLSWKDGMLDPVAADDLAARVEASADARALVSRIDEVVGRPTLSAPAPDAAGFAVAANTTAEYLDNVLPVESLGEFERVCFASEAQLAETAATHEILAALSRAPAAPLAAAARRRLLAAVRARTEGAGPPAQTARVPAPSPRPQAPRRPAPAAARPSTSAWLLVGAALLLLTALVGVLGWSMTKAGRARGRAREVAAQKAAAAAPVPARAPAPPAEPAPAVPLPAAPTPAVAATAPAAPPAASVAPDAQAPVPSPPVAAAEPEPAGMQAAVAPQPIAIQPVAPPAAAPVPPPATPPQVSVVEPRVPQGDALAIAAPAASPPVATPQVAAVPATAPVPAAAPVVTAATVSGRDVVLYRAANEPAAAWLAAGEAAPLDVPVDLIAPPFCRPTVVVDDMRITLVPGTRAVLRRDAAGAPQLEVVFGAAVIAGPGRLGVVAGGIAGTIATGPAAPAGVEVALQRPPGADAEATRRLARIVPAVGRITWQPGAGGTGRDVAAGQALEWRSGVVSEPELRDAGPAPDWLDDTSGAAALERRAAAAVAARLAAGGAAVPALRELAAHRRVENRVGAAAALALVGEFDDLARLLVAEGGAALPESLWDRLDAVAVQPALARGARAADAWAAAVAAHAPAGAAAEVIRFARGPTDDELAAGAADELVAALESPHLAVRRYAIKNLVAIVEPPEMDRLRYRADRPPEALRAGAAWWRAQLERGNVRRAGAEGGVDR